MTICICIYSTRIEIPINNMVSSHVFSPSSVLIVRLDHVHGHSLDVESIFNFIKLVFFGSRYFGQSPSSRNSINNILHIIPPPALPESTSVKSLDDIFSKNLVDKIETVLSKFPDKVQSIISVQKNSN